LKDTEYIDENVFQSFQEDCSEILKLLISIVKSTKKSLKR